MWIILLFLCVSEIVLNNAQELTSFEVKTATETIPSKNGENWDSTRPPVTLSIRNGRTDSVDQSATKNSDLPLFYTNQWQPILMPLGFNNNRDYNIYVNGNEHSLDNPLVPTFLRRPDSAANNTVPYPYSQFVERNGFSDVPEPYAPLFYLQRHSNLSSEPLISNTEEVNPEVLPNESIPTNAGNFQTLNLYSNTQHFIPPEVSFPKSSQPNLNLDGVNHENDKELRQISSSEVSRLPNSDTISSRTNVETIKPLETVDHHPEQVAYNPVNFYRNNQRYLPQMVQAYYPAYPFSPFHRDGPFQPMVPYLSNNPLFDRETGPKVDDRIPVIPEKEVLSEYVSDRSPENVPSETSTDITPPPSLPLPVGGYPFGLYPPSFLPPLIPNIQAPGFAFNPLPLPQPAHVPRENILAETSRLPPIVPIRSIPEVLPQVSPQTDNLATEEERRVLTDMQINLEEGIDDETSNLTRIPYEFGFDMNDGKGNDQHRQETSDISGVVTGSYGYRDLYGIYRLVNYIADKDGFRAFIKSNEPGVASSGSAHVVVMAERPPARALAEGRKEIEIQDTTVPLSNTDFISTASISESK